MTLQLPLRSVHRRANYHWFVVATVCVGAFMAALDSSIVNIALPIMKRDFHTHMRIIEWVSLSYILALAALIVPFGRLADIFGRRWMYITGFGVFIIGSFMCGFAPTFTVLILSRVLQAVGAAMLQANSVSIITATTPPRARGKAIGIQASAQGVGLSLGPVIGGTLVTLVGWRWIFYVNVPVGIIGIALGVLLLPEDAKKVIHEKFDLFGALCLAPTLIALIYMLNTGTQAGFASPLMVISYIVMVVGLSAFIFIESRVRAPIVDFALFRNHTFLFGNIAVTLSFAVMYAVLFLAPFYLDNVHKMSALTSGLFLTVVPLGMTLFTPISGAIADKVGAKLPTVIGILMAFVGAGLLSVFSVIYLPVLFVIGLFFVGSGMGMFTPANNSQVMGSAPPNRLGISGGVLNMSRTLGMGIGVTVGGMSYQLFLRTHGALSENLATVAQMVPSFGESFSVISILSLAIVALVIGSRSNPED